MDVKTVAFALMGVASVVTLALHALLHRRRVKAYRAELTDDSHKRGVRHG